MRQAQEGEVLVDPQQTRFQQLLDSVRRHVTKLQFSTWFQRTNLVRWQGSDVVLGVPNRFFQQWIEKDFRPLLERCAEQVAQGPVVLRLEVVVPPASAAPAPSAAPPPTAPPAGAPPEAAAGAPPADGAAAAPAPARPAARAFHGTGESDQPLLLGEHYTFANFISGPSNQLAHASAQAVARDPGNSYNPLFIHGSVGLGKTHLLHAVCHAFLAHSPGQRICFLSCAEFVNEFLVSLKANDVDRFRARFRDVHLLVIDDIHILAGKERTQEEFFHLFNRLYQQRRQIVISSDAPPSEIPTLEDRLVSRFKWGLVAPLEQPEMETRMAILRRKAELQGVEIPNDVVEYIASSFRSNIREIEGALLSLVARSRVMEQPIDLALAHEALAPSLDRVRPAITLDTIAERVSSHYQVKPADLRSKKRTRVVSLARQVVMYLARQVTALSYEEIGHHLGGRDHTTVLYGVQKVEATLATNPRFAAEVSRLLDRLR